VRRFCFGVAAAASLIGLSASVQAAEVVLQMASTFPSSTALIGQSAQRLSEKIRRASGGQIALAFHEPGALVPGADTVKAVSQGTVQAAWAGAGWFAGIDSAFNMFSSVPFGPGIGEYMAWMYYGGGLSKSRELFHRHGIHNVPCAVIPPEASGWFRKEIKTVDDLRGLRMRFFGLGARVVERFGVQTRQLPPGEILAELKADKLDATEFSLPQIDETLGFHEVAKYYYFPGWHQQATFFDLYINKSVWDSLEERHKAVIELACGDTIRDTIAEGEASQGLSIKRMQAQGVQVRRWAPEILLAFESAWNDVAREEAAKNPSFREVYGSYLEFRAGYAAWSYLGYVE
jgi:TRAP-type mannitol/chloroaromatic compound transport system substrate-binding protein